MNEAKKAQKAVIEARVLLELAEEELKNAENLSSAKAVCEQLSAEMKALEPEQFDRDMDKYEAACDEVLARMKEPSDRLYEETKERIDQVRSMKQLVRDCEAALIEVVRTHAPEAAGKALPPSVVGLLEQIASGGALGAQFRPRLVDVCMHWSGR